MEPRGEFLPEPLYILDQKETILRTLVVTHVKVQWKNFKPREATWECEEILKEAYPTLLKNEGEEE